MIYYTSDLHLGHANIILYCDRPFRKLDGQFDVESMNQHLLNAYNQVVKPDDTVYFIGDILMGLKSESLKIFKQYLGKKYLVAGNHDYRKPGKLRPELLDAGFEYIGEELIVEDSGKVLYLKHIPDPDWKAKHPSADYHLCGHIHNWSDRLSTIDGKLVPAPDGNIINVGVDVTPGFKPMTLSELSTRPHVVNQPHRENNDETNTVHI